MSKNIAVIGAGAIGLCSAWHLQQSGARVTIFEMNEVGNGASWGNAGQILPSKSVPLSDPANLKYALRSFLKKNSPITAPRNFDADLIKYLATFTRNSTKKNHHIGSNSMWSLGKMAFDEYEVMELAGVITTRKEGPFTAAFKNSKTSYSLIDELDRARKSFPDLDFDLLNQSQLLSNEPLLDERFTFGVRLKKQFYLNPPAFLHNLSSFLIQREIELVTKKKIIDIESTHNGVKLIAKNGDHYYFDAVVIATGAWLNRLTGQHGVKHPVIAGIGYSLSVDVPHQTQGMLYLPEMRLATTNYRDKLRISTFMQMTDVETPFNAVRMNRLIEMAKKELPKAKWDSAGDYWSGGRPLSGDGKPLIGGTKSQGVFVNSGHGMWGITLAPISGRLISDLILKGKAISKEFDPLR